MPLGSSEEPSLVGTISLDQVLSISIKKKKKETHKVAIIN